MKPRVFLGSSVEGLSVAYSIQTNLTHDADITVWSQGVFELSKTIIESLFDILNSVDFGIFVFTPDDLLKIREVSTNTVRDNVLFEFGLFLGKLGRQRVFFVVPSDEDLHLPTDLLRITPAKYESKRDDNNLLAATGAASYQIRLLLQKLGPLQQIEEISNTPEVLDSKHEEKDSWFQDWLSKKFQDAIEKLNVEINIQQDKMQIIRLKVIKAVCEYKLDEKYSHMEDVLIEFDNELEAYIRIGYMLTWEDFTDKAISILEKGREKFGNSIELIQALASAYLQNGDKENAVECFQDELTYSDANTTIRFANIYIEEKKLMEARAILHKAYLNLPNNKELCFKYASIATELKENEIALYLYDKLLAEDPQNISYNGYLGNICLNLNLNDTALVAYQKANELANDNQEWIVSNIGNILKNRGFYSEGIKYLRKGIEINKSSGYALERLATTLKLIDDEQKEYNNNLSKGRNLLREYTNTLSLNALN